METLSAHSDTIIFPLPPIKLQRVKMDGKASKTKAPQLHYTPNSPSRMDYSSFSRTSSGVELNKTTPFRTQLRSQLAPVAPALSPKQTYQFFPSTVKNNHLVTEQKEEKSTEVVGLQANASLQNPESRFDTVVMTKTIPMPVPSSTTPVEDTELKNEGYRSRWKRIRLPFVDSRNSGSDKLGTLRAEELSTSDTERPLKRRRKFLYPRREVSYLPSSSEETVIKVRKPSPTGGKQEESGISTKDENFPTRLRSISPPLSLVPEKSKGSFIPTGLRSVPQPPTPLREKFKRTFFPTGLRSIPHPSSAPSGKRNKPLVQTESGSEHQPSPPRHKKRKTIQSGWLSVQKISPSHHEKQMGSFLSNENPKTPPNSYPLSRKGNDSRVQQTGKNFIEILHHVQKKTSFPEVQTKDGRTPETNYVINLEEEPKTMKTSSPPHFTQGAVKCSPSSRQKLNVHHTEKSPAHLTQTVLISNPRKNEDPNDNKTRHDAQNRTEGKHEWDTVLPDAKTLSSQIKKKRLRNIPPCRFLDSLSEKEEAQLLKLYRQKNQKEIKYIPSARIVLRGEDFKRLRGVRWLNDEVINAYMSLINVRNDSIFEELPEDERKNIPQTYVFNTFFYTRLTSGSARYDYSGVRRWTGRNKVDVMKQDLLLFPVNLGNHHWVLAGIDRPRRSFFYLDSMARADKSGVLRALRRWYYDEVEDKYGEDVATQMELETWPSAHNRYMIRRAGVLPAKLEPRIPSPRLSRIPMQTDGGSCGVFITKIADCLSLGIKIYFNQTDIHLVRSRMALDLFRGRLPL
ncbi:unnamed protein product [Agarophyton chilense]